LTAGRVLHDRDIVIVIAVEDSHASAATLRVVGMVAGCIQGDCRKIEMAGHSCSLDGIHRHGSTSLRLSLRYVALRAGLSPCSWIETQSGLNHQVLLCDRGCPYSAVETSGQVIAADLVRSEVAFLSRRGGLDESLCYNLLLPSSGACFRVPHCGQTCNLARQENSGSCLFGILPLGNDGDMWLVRPLSCMVCPRAAHAECLLAGSQYCSEIQAIATAVDGENGSVESTDASQPHWRLVAQVLATWHEVLLGRGAETAG
jgi:hypothetical protein